MLARVYSVLDRRGRDRTYNKNVRHDYHAMMSKHCQLLGITDN